ncbi:MAG TPA: glycoside hydrolase family 1 protein [Actinomycetales bacterium]|nr:glycoside hydrolase family 1 protein [Actinomycetales bacterium]
MTETSLRGILLGTASAALQIEGNLPRTNWHDWAAAGNIADGTTPHPTTDHWQRWRDDNALMQELGLQIARISIEWARIEPSEGQIDHSALDRYREEIADLRERGIRPMVTLHHFGNPGWLEDQGAWTDEAAVAKFLGFVDHVVGAVGDLVDDWVTINEPNVYATQGYMFREGPPGVTSWPKLRRVIRHLAVAHCEAYRIIHERLDAPGRRVNVTFAHHVRHFEPKNPNNPVHRFFTRVDDELFHRSVEKAFFSGVFDAFVGTPGRAITPGRYVDVIAVNYYSRTAVTGMSDGVFDGVEVTDLGWEIYPEGIVQVSRVLHERYGRLPVWITENGCADNGDSDSLERFRCRYILSHLVAMASSEVPFERYYHWCFVDNWEWSEGMVPRFGIVHLDRKTLARTPKPSARMIRDLIRAGAITDEIRERYEEPREI